MSKPKEKVFSVTIHDCRVDTFTCPGPGGQHRNSTQSGVRVTHEPSGASAACCEERHQHTNKARAFRRMAQSPLFQAWAKLEVAKRSGVPTIESQVDAWMDPKFIKVETRNSQGIWENAKASLL